MCTSPRLRHRDNRDSIKFIEEEKKNPLNVYIRITVGLGHTQSL